MREGDEMDDPVRRQERVAFLRARIEREFDAARALPDGPRRQACLDRIMSFQADLEPLDPNRAQEVVFRLVELENERAAEGPRDR